MASLCLGAEGPSALQTPSDLFLSPLLPRVTVPTFTYTLSLSVEGRRGVGGWVGAHGPISMNGCRHVGPGQPVRYLSSSPQPVTDWCLSGYLNSRRSSIKVTRVATNVLAEQTMSREADGGGQLRGRTKSGERRTRRLLKPPPPPPPPHHPAVRSPARGGQINVSPPLQHHHEDDPAP